ncbi:TPA: lanthionine synthetase C family protein [Streptococcus suis]|uniref:Nisin biosynthesis protein nisC n=2 Tax=Streptococcus TaxID=1301 RepID=V6Z199_STRAG|nr:lanthionine synthetase C family protein [Streptococcus suis]ESV54011.1 Nisin biosynthesis protein nisC [Streptococcus agalactiae LMG 14747]MCO8237825.1 lanthionine synthetase C family protein [Streptococcus suis]MDW8658930.1 lanthionine synthetase C family protein [Streptococcus suis]NQG56710.1 lanthionine synthetase C family protein [Streptococcus suis]NQG60533.1 lanthionine synthetase C family protein [Streptococcus suis]
MMKMDELLEDVSKITIAEYDFELDNIINSNNNYDVVTLSRGLPGYILLVSELNSNHVSSYEEKLTSYIEILVSILSERGVMTGSLYSGAAGIGISLLHLNENKYKRLVESLDEYIEYFVSEFLPSIDTGNMSPTDYDIIEGVSGILVYISLHDRERLKDVQRKIVNFLTSSFKEDIWNDIFYVTSQNQMSESESVLFPKGCLNLGVAHGLAGVGIALAYTMIKGNFSCQIEETLRHIIDVYEQFETPSLYTWKDGLDIDELKQGYSNSKFLPNIDAWCYGSPGISLLYMYCGVALNDEYLKNKAVEILKTSMERQSGIDSPILCHGYAGLLEICQFFKYVYQTDEFDKYIYDFDKKITQYLQSKRNNELQIISQFGYLNGDVGVLLSMLHIYSKNVNTYWQAGLLLFKDIIFE